MMLYILCQMAIKYHSLSQDNMPCVVPDLSQFNMPCIVPEKQTYTMPILKN